MVLHLAAGARICFASHLAWFPGVPWSESEGGFKSLLNLGKNLSDFWFGVLSYMVQLCRLSVRQCPTIYPSHFCGHTSTLLAGRIWTGLDSCESKTWNFGLVKVTCHVCLSVCLSYVDRACLVIIVSTPLHDLGNMCDLIYTKADSLECCKRQLSKTQKLYLLSSKFEIFPR